MILLELLIAFLLANDGFEIEFLFQDALKLPERRAIPEGQDIPRSVAIHIGIMVFQAALVGGSHRGNVTSQVVRAYCFLEDLYVLFFHLEDVVSADRAFPPFASSFATGLSATFMECWEQSVPGLASLPILAQGRIQGLGGTLDALGSLPDESVPLVGLEYCRIGNKNRNSLPRSVTVG